MQACVFFSVMWENTIPSLRYTQWEHIQRGMCGKAYLQQFVHGCLQVGQLVFILPLHTCQNFLHFLSLLKHETEAVRGEAGLEPLKRAFIGLYRDSLWGEPNLKSLKLLTWNVDTYLLTCFYKGKYIIKVHLLFTYLLFIIEIIQIEFKCDNLG